MIKEEKLLEKLKSIYLTVTGEGSDFLRLHTAIVELECFFALYDQSFYFKIKEQKGTKTKPTMENNNGLKPNHKCRPLAVAAMDEGREWWVGELIEKIPEWPVETHCLHLKTPLKDVVFLCNSGDFSQLSVLAAVALGYQINPSWMARQIEMAKDRTALLNSEQERTSE